MPQIIVRNLCKTYRLVLRRPGLWGAVSGLWAREHKDIAAVAGIDFEVAAGEIVGYIGPNGAGKSTTVKLLAGILVPDSGECTVMGRTPWKDRVEHVRRIGAVFGHRTQLWWDLPTIESFELLREIYSVEPAQYRRRLDELVPLMEIADLLDTPVRQLSLGQRMRCDLVATLLHGPEILFLDEPTIGLDVEAKLRVRELVQQINREKGTTVILTTHDMEDIEALCPRVMVIDRGTIVFDGALGDLRAHAGRERWLTVELAQETPDFELPNTTLRKRMGPRYQLCFDPSDIDTTTVINRLTRDYAVRDLLVEDPPIETIVAELYRRNRMARP